MSRLIIVILISNLLIGPLTAQNKLETVILKGHSGTIYTMEFLPDGKYFLTGSDDKSVKLWEIETGREIRSYVGHQSAVFDIEVSADGKTFFTASRDRTVKKWDVLTGKNLATYREHENSVTSVAIHPDGNRMASSGTERIARIWDLRTGKVIHELKTDPGQYGARIRFNPDGTKVLIGNDDHKLQVYDTESGVLDQRLRDAYGMCGGCYSRFDISPDGKYALSGSRRNGIVLWDLTTNSLIRKYDEDAEDNYRSIEYHPDGQKALISAEKSVTIIETSSGDTLVTFDPETVINYATFSPDGSMILTGGNDNSPAMWDAASGELINRFSGYLNLKTEDGLDYDPNSYWEGYIYDLLSLKNFIKVSPDGKYAVRGKLGFDARMWELASGKITRLFKGHEKVVICFNFSADGKYLVTGSGDGSARIWEVETGKEVMAFEGHRALIFSVNFSHNGKYIVTGSYDGTAKVWDIATGDQIQRIDIEPSPDKIDSPYVIKFLPGDQYLVAGVLAGNLKIWEIDTGREFREYIGHTKVVSSVDFDPTGKYMVSGSWDQNAKVWDILNGMVLLKLEGHDDPINDVKYSPSGEQIVTVSTDRTAILWDARTGKMIRKFEGHNSIITSVVFINGGKQLVTGTIDGITKVWNAETGAQIFSHIVIGRDDWMVTNSKGYFNATEGARKYIYFVKGMKSYELDQFFEEFYRPDLLDNLFGVRGFDNTENLADRLAKSPPPKIDIISPESKQPTKLDVVDILFKVTNEGGGVDEVRVVHNGKVLPLGEEFTKVSIPRGKSRFFNMKLPLVAGKNIIRISAFTDDRIESRAQQLILESGSGAVRPKMFLVAIGINQYQNPNMNLNYAKADALSFIEMMQSRGSSIFESVEIHPIYDVEATREKILAKLDELSQKISPDDVFVFYYAGHGSMVEGNFYFIPTENVRMYNEERLRKEAIPAGVMQQKFQSINALKQMVVMDACQSGGSVELLAQRGTVEEKALAQLSRSAGVHVLSAAGSEQFATEFEELGHGLFTYVLLEALAGKADGAPKDGKVTIYELKSYLDSMVPDYSSRLKGKVQYPYTFSRGHDFPIVTTGN